MPGHDTIFVNGVDNHYICGICHLVLREPFQTECGHRFCQSCIEVVITSGSKRCPVDHSLLSRYVIFKDAFCNREILDLQCFCSSKDRGCNWTGPLKELEEHHKKCPRFLLECPEGCQKIMLRSEMAVHLYKDCSFLYSNCPMTGQCNFQGSRDEVREHLKEKNVEHTLMITKLLPSSQSDIRRVQTSIAQTHKQQQVLVRSLDNYRKEFGALRGDLANVQVKVDSYEKSVTKSGVTQPQSVREPTADRRSDGSELEDIKARLVELEDRMKLIQFKERQQESTQHLAVANEGANEAVAELVGRLVTIEQQNSLRGIRIADHDVKIFSLETTTYDGDFLWKVDDFGQRQQDAIAGRCLCIDSPEFYVGRYGYKVRARAFLNGDGIGKGTHLSLFFVVMRGAQDAILSWPFKMEVMIKLIDQSEGNHIIHTFQPCLQRPTEYQTENAGFPQFLQKSELMSGGYIRENTMFIKITMKPSSVVGL